MAIELGEPIREGFIHELSFPGIRSAAGEEILGPIAYYQVVKSQRTR
jgi:hypothetical protein